MVSMPGKGQAIVIDDTVLEKQVPDFGWEGKDVHGRGRVSTIYYDSYTQRTTSEP
jgi:hypothetical protein